MVPERTICRDETLIFVRIKTTASGLINLQKTFDFKNWKKKHKNKEHHRMNVT